MHLNQYTTPTSIHKLSLNPGLAAQSSGMGSTARSPVLSRRELQRVILDMLG